MLFESALGFGLQTEPYCYLTPSSVLVKVPMGISDHGSLSRHVNDRD